MVAAVLKRMIDTVVSQEDLYGIIVGAAIGSDGATGKVGYQVPSPRGQADVIKCAWSAAGRSPGTAAYIE